jgi:hypothetical protein
MALPDDVSAQLEHARDTATQCPNDARELIARARAAAYDGDIWTLSDLLESDERVVVDYTRDALQSEWGLRDMFVDAHQSLPWSHIATAQGRPRMKYTAQLKPWLDIFRLARSSRLGGGCEYMWRAWLLGSLYPVVLPSILDYVFDSQSYHRSTNYERIDQSEHSPVGRIALGRISLTAPLPVGEYLGDWFYGARPRGHVPRVLAHTASTGFRHEPVNWLPLWGCMDGFDMSSLQDAADTAVWMGIPTPQGVRPSTDALTCWRRSDWYRADRDRWRDEEPWSGRAHR